MALFTTRVVLHGAEENDYEKLHEAMEKEDFSRTIESDDEKIYHMPPAEYNYEGDITRADLMKKVKRAANTTGFKYGILISECTGRRWYNLDSAEE